jgi:two-component system sensor histidine kinase VicK
MNSGTVPALPDDIFQIIFERSPGSLLVGADLPRFTILAVSDTYLEITSTKRGDIIGKGFFEAFPDDENFNDEANARNVFTKVIETGQKIDVPTYRYDIINPQTKEREIHYWSCCNAPISDGYLRVAYILNTVVDITGEVKAKEAAIENENRLRLAAEAAALGTWELNLQDQSFVYSPRLAEIFGHQHDSLITLTDIREQVNADDMQNIVVRAYHESLITGKYLYEVRIYWQDNSMHWIKVQGLVVNNEKNIPVELIGTILDITESKRDEIRKNDFIAMASHELKTPLTSLKAYIQLLSKRLDSSNDSFTNNALSKANLQVNRMTDLIHGFLDLSKIEPGKLRLKVAEFEMNKLVEETIAEVYMINPSRTIIFEPKEPITIFADREKISQVISNFLSNALKYSERGSEITVSCQEIDCDLKVSVTDEGIGIKASDQKKLFQRFYRVENEKVKNISGFGIGLYLSSEIIQRHKGKIGVISEEDKGSTFYFTLPLQS